MNKILCVSIIVLILIINLNGCMINGSISGNEDEMVTSEIEKTEIVIDEKDSEVESGGLYFTLVDYSLDYTEYLQEKYQPEEGQKYIMVEIYCECKGDYFGYIGCKSFECYVDDTLVEQVYGIDGTTYLTGASFNGVGSATLRMFFEVPVEYTEIKVEHHTMGERLIFKLD